MRDGTPAWFPGPTRSKGEGKEKCTSSHLYEIMCGFILHSKGKKKESDEEGNVHHLHCKNRSVQYLMVDAHDNSSLEIFGLGKDKE